jgi:hypothetical protein
MSSQNTHPVDSIRGQNSKQTTLPNGTEGEQTVKKITHIAYQPDATLVTISAWTVSEDGDTITYHRTELTWDYVDEVYNVYEYSYDHEFNKESQTLDFNNTHWHRYARHVINRTIELRPRLTDHKEYFNEEGDKVKNQLNTDDHYETVAKKLGIGPQQ